MKGKPRLSINGGFGGRLSTFRKTRGLTQEQLGDKIGVSQRVIAYYEGQSQHIPANLLIPVAKTLRVSVDELLGLKPSKDTFSSKNARLWGKLRIIENLPPKDQKAVINYIEALSIKQKAKTKK